MKFPRYLIPGLVAVGLAAIALWRTGDARALQNGAQTVPIKGVIELFTSQSCSYCPPADQLLQKFSQRPDLIALSLPVDYWDYTGWKDTFGTAKNTERQRAYAKARGDGAIYTPQAVINGMVHVNGADEAAIEYALKSTEDAVEAERVPVLYRQERNTLIIEVAGAMDMHKVKEATIWLGVVQTSGTVEIAAGENKGRTLSYTNIVQELVPVGLWRGMPLRVQLPRQAIMQADTQKSVVLIQQGRAGPIVGSAWVGLW